MSHPIQSGDQFVLQPSRHYSFSLEYLLQLKFDKEKHLRKETQRGVPLQNHFNMRYERCTKVFYVSATMDWPWNSKNHLCSNRIYIRVDVTVLRSFSHAHNSLLFAWRARRRLSSFTASPGWFSWGTDKVPFKSKSMSFCLVLTQVRCQLDCPYNSTIRGVAAD